MSAATPSFLPLPAVVRATSLSKPSIYRGIKAGTFPRPVQISARRVAWPAESIAAWAAGLTA